VDELLLLARTDSGSVDLDLAPADLGEVVLDAAGSLSTLAERAGVRLVVDAAPARLRGDAARLRQLLTILVDNAVRHSPAGGEVRITAQPGTPAHVLRVDDPGPGIRPEDLPHVFDRFWRAPDAPAGGTGLGLAIAAWIVERHGGAITAANRPAGGARFEVRLPAA
jgi:two-component system sensor histidine kinase BaeS